MTTSQRQPFPKLPITEYDPNPRGKKALRSYWERGQIAADLTWPGKNPQVDRGKAIERGGPGGGHCSCCARSRKLVHYVAVRIDGTAWAHNYVYICPDPDGDCAFLGSVRSPKEILR